MAWSGTLSANALKAALLQRFGLRFCFVRLRFCTDKKVIALAQIRYGNPGSEPCHIGPFHSNRISERNGRHDYRLPSCSV